jgi:hypothetical protein
LLANLLIIDSITAMLDSHTHFILVLAKLHTGGVAAVADAVEQQRSSLFAALAGKRPVPAHVLEKMARLLGIDSAGFSRHIVQPWLARDDGDLFALEQLGARITVLARIQSSTEKSGGTAQKHYFLLRAEAGKTVRYAIVRMRPSVSDAFQRRKQIDHIAKYVADYRHIAALHTLSADIDTSDPLAFFVREVLHDGAKKHSDAAQNLLNLALKESATLATLEQVHEGTKAPVILLNPALVQEIALGVACDIYMMQILDRQAGEAIGKTNAGRPITIKVMSSPDDNVTFTLRLVKTRPQHLLILKAHRTNAFPVFEVAFDGPFEDALKAQRPRSSSLRQAAKTVADHDIELQIKRLRRQNDGVGEDDRLQKR